MTDASGQSTQFGELTDVRVERRADTDRVVFDFGGAAPGYDIRYASLSEVTGAAKPLTGAMALIVELSPASGESYDGPTRIPLGTSDIESGVVEEVVRTTDGESRVVWAVGVRERVPFTVARGPRQLSVDLAHED